MVGRKAHHTIEIFECLSTYFKNIYQKINEWVFTPIFQFRCDENSNIPNRLKPQHGKLKAYRRQYDWRCTNIQRASRKITHSIWVQTIETKYNEPV